MRVLILYKRGVYKTDIEATQHAVNSIRDGAWLSRLVDGGKHVPDNDCLISCYIPDPEPEAGDNGQE